MCVSILIGECEVKPIILQAELMLTKAVEIRHGMGKHVWDIDFPNDYVPMMEVCYRPPGSPYGFANIIADNRA